MEEIEKLKKIIEGHEDRISKLEKLTLKPIKSNKIKNGKDDYSGRSGGIQMLIDNNFLSNPKLSAEVYDEMKKNGYYKSPQSVDSALRNVFVKKRILERIKEEGKWKYVVRK
ncbi:MAG: hypothetical protein RI100_00580 [Nitrosarchaeum sp.]|jgi:hypothetical protein|uniref:hypothetical protein n=1 Tax=Nitrosarchaeum sp. TaxID=2026886 RepID=UPI002DE5ED1E|nr:hypothetical protein [Nitrosarchaeum sp.]